MKSNGSVPEKRAPRDLHEAVNCYMDAEIFGCCFVDETGLRVHPGRVVVSAKEAKATDGRRVFRPGPFLLDYEARS